MTITAEKQLDTPATPSRPSSADTDRARVRSDVTLAARVIPTHYPLETFIAVNPLAGLEGMPFEQAVRRAGDLYGTAGTVGEAAFRQMHRQGRITDADLDSALARRYPNLSAESTLRIGGRTISPVELLRAEGARSTQRSDSHELVLEGIAIACYAMSLAPVTWVVIAEIFPNRIRGAAMSMAKGVPAVRVTKPDEVGPAIERALATPGPFLIDAVLEGNVHPEMIGVRCGQ